jgi:hypothetical protein
VELSALKEAAVLQPPKFKRLLAGQPKRFQELGLPKRYSGLEEVIKFPVRLIGDRFAQNKAARFSRVLFPNNSTGVQLK